MQLQPTRDTAPEIAVRRLLHSWGYRYRVDAQPLKGLRRRADVVFRGPKVAVYVDGCFWHGCPEHGKRNHRANADFWSEKIARNQSRDRHTDQLLVEAGWLVVRAWEHDDPEAVALQVVSAVKARRGANKTGTHR
jgi:DNA mismatch endonuclease (patch repair protein)